MMKKFTLGNLLCLPLIALFSASIFAEAGEGGGGIRMEDDLGVWAELSAPPQRIVSLAPSNTELLFALGLGDRLVGVTAFCDYPDSARAIDKVADYNSMSIEKILAAKPDLVLAARGNDREGLQTLRLAGLQVFALDIQTIDQLLVAVGRVGALGGVESRAAVLSKDLEERVQKIRARVDSLDERPRVMWGYLGEPIYTAGAHTMIDDVFRTAGGNNVGSLAPGAWPQVGLETVVAWAPEVIITTAHGGSPEELRQKVQQMRQTAGWKSIPAVREGRVYFIDGDLLNRPGPRLIDALEKVAYMLHPEMFARP